MEVIVTKYCYNYLDFLTKCVHNETIKLKFISFIIIYIPSLRMTRKFAQSTSVRYDSIEPYPT